LKKPQRDEFVGIGAVWYARYPGVRSGDELRAAVHERREALPPLTCLGRRSHEPPCVDGRVHVDGSSSAGKRELPDRGNQAACSCGPNPLAGSQQEKHLITSAEADD
jgi:hypothetical protein